MTYEEAIKHLICGRINCLTDMDKDEELRYVCLKALEKQIPKKPYWEYGGYHCKSCGLDISEDDAYCPLCGQAIDWSDYE